MKIVIGADPWGAELKDKVINHLAGQGHDIVDVGSTGEGGEVDYYEVAARAARKIQSGETERGILFCGTGMGVAIVANKFNGIYASVIESEFAAKMCRAVNNANIMTMGAMIVAPHQALRCVDAFVGTAHTQDLPEDVGCFLKDSLGRIAAIEKENMKARQ